MAKDFSIDGSALVITESGIVIFESPKRDVYFKSSSLENEAKVVLYDTNAVNKNASGLLTADLSECTDNGTPFTNSSFRTFARENLGFNQGGGSPSGTPPWKYTATNYTDLTTNVAPTATEGELAIVYNSQGIWAINRKLKGVYIYQGGTWEYANQELQDKIKENTVEITALEADVLTNTNNIALKRDLTAQKNSIESDSGDLQLVGDSASVGNSQYYGTDASGVKGFHNLTGGGSGDMTKAVYDPNNVGGDAFDYANFLGMFQITGASTSINLSSDIDNLNLSGFNIVHLSSGSQDRRITGIVAPSSGVNRVIVFFNDQSNFRIKFVHQSGSSLANNRIVLRGSAGTRNLLPYQLTLAIYNHSINKWYITRMA